jgi:hypothetical protein
MVSVKQLKQSLIIDIGQYDYIYVNKMRPRYLSHLFANRPSL